MLPDLKNQWGFSLESIHATKPLKTPKTCILTCSEKKWRETSTTSVGTTVKIDVGMLVLQITWNKNKG
jgi:hypothetical protein